MGRKTDLTKLREKSLTELTNLETRFTLFEAIIPSKGYHLLRWISAMSIVDLHSIWERFAENRLIISLNHHPNFFIEENEIRGVKSISRGLSNVLVRGNNKYFDFRSSADLIDKGKKLLDSNNPFLALKGTEDSKYLDTISAIRNFVVHKSAVSSKSYKRALNLSFTIKSAPEPYEFLNAIDYRKVSPARGQKRLFVLTKVVSDIVKKI